MRCTLFCLFVVSVVVISMLSLLLLLLSLLLSLCYVVVAVVVVVDVVVDVVVAVACCCLSYGDRFVSSTAKSTFCCLLVKVTARLRVRSNGSPLQVTANMQNTVFFQK